MTRMFLWFIVILLFATEIITPAAASGSDGFGPPDDLNTDGGSSAIAVDANGGFTVKRSRKARTETKIQRHAMSNMFSTSASAASAPAAAARAAPAAPATANAVCQYPFPDADDKVLELFSNSQVHSITTCAQLKAKVEGITGITGSCVISQTKRNEIEARSTSTEREKMDAHDFATIAKALCPITCGCPDCSEDLLAPDDQPFMTPTQRICAFLTTWNPADYSWDAARVRALHTWAGTELIEDTLDDGIGAGAGCAFSLCSRTHADSVADHDSKSGTYKKIFFTCARYCHHSCGPFLRSLSVGNGACPAGTSCLANADGCVGAD